MFYNPRWIPSHSRKCTRLIEKWFSDTNLSIWNQTLLNSRSINLAKNNPPLQFPTEYACSSSEGREEKIIGKLVNFLLAVNPSVSPNFKRKPIRNVPKRQQECKELTFAVKNTRKKKSDKWFTYIVVVCACASCRQGSQLSKIDMLNTFLPLMPEWFDFTFDVISSVWLLRV